MPNTTDVGAIMSLAVGHDRFLTRNTGLTNDPAVDHFVLNPDLVLANNRHQKSISQQEGQPNGDATTEGQSLLILGYIYMYKATKEKYWLDRAIAFFDSYVEHFYGGQPIPDPPGRWLSNWIINGKEPILANWPVNFDQPTHSGFLGTPFTFTNGRVSIPQGAPNWGEYLDKATFAFIGALAWNTIVASVQATREDGSTDWNTDGIKMDVDWVVDYLGRKVDWDGNILEAVATEPKGTVQLKDATFTGTAKLCYANCQPVEHGGYLIGRNEIWHNRPLRVPVQNQGDYGNASDAEQWFGDAAFQLWKITGERKYWLVWRCVIWMCYSYSDIDQKDRFFRQSRDAQTPFTDGISYDYTYPDGVTVDYGRDSDGYITIHANAAGQHTMEQQSISYKVNEESTVQINVGGVDTSGEGLTARATLTLTPEKESGAESTWGVSLAKTSSTVATYSLPMSTFTAETDANGLDYIVADSRVMSDYGTVTHQYLFEDNVLDTRSALIVKSTLQSEDDGIIIGFWLTESELVNPTSIVYRSDAVHDFWIRVTDDDGWRWHWTLPPSTEWVNQPLVKSAMVLNGYQPGANGRPNPTAPNFGPQSQLLVIVDEMLGTPTAEFSWYCVNAVPTLYTGEAFTKKFSITIQGQTEFTALLGDCDVQNPELNILAYTPGVIPFSNNATQGTLQYDGWHGMPYPGYQHPFIYVYENDSVRLNNMVDFLYDSQQAYQTQFGVLGPVAAAYIWNRWDNLKYGTPDTFTFYHWGTDEPWSGYQPRAFASAARAWFELVQAEKEIPIKLVEFTENWINWLVDFVRANGRFPTEFPSSTLPTAPDGDWTGHMTGLWLAGASFAGLAGSRLKQLDWLCEMAVKELNDNFEIVAANHAMNGSWSPAVRADTDNGMFFGFWTGEIFRGLGAFLLYRRGAPGEQLIVGRDLLSKLTLVIEGTFTDGLVRAGDLPSLDADVKALETKVTTLQDYYDTKLAQKTSWEWSDVAGVPYAQTPNPGVQWGAQPIAGLLQYGEVTGAIADGDHLIAATPAAMLTLQTYFQGALSASRKVNGYDLRHDVFVTAEDLGSYSTNVILEKAAERRGPTDLAGDDYRWIKSTATYNPTTTDAPGLPGTIIAITPTSITMTYYKFAVLRKGIWSVA